MKIKKKIKVPRCDICGRFMKRTELVICGYRLYTCGHGNV